MRPRPSDSHPRGHKRQKSSVLSSNFYYPDQDDDQKAVYSYPTHLIPSVYPSQQQGRPVLPSHMEQPVPLQPGLESAPSLPSSLPGPQLLATSLVGQSTRIPLPRHFAHRNNLSISSHLNTVTLDPENQPSLDAVANPLVGSLVKQLDGVDNSNINNYLLEVTRKLALSLPIDEFFSLLFNNNAPIADQAAKIDHSSVDSENLRKVLQAVGHILQFFKQPSTLAMVIPSAGSNLSNINFHELQRTFLAFKILDEILEVGPAASPRDSIPRPYIYKVYYILCQHCIAKYPFTADREEKQGVLLGQSKFGKLLKLAFPSVKIKRLGSRGDSKYHFLGVKWNTDLVTDEILGLCAQKDIPELNYLFTHSTKSAPQAPRASLENRENLSATPTSKADIFPVARLSSIKPTTLLTTEENADLLGKRFDKQELEDAKREVEALIKCTEEEIVKKQWKNKSLFRLVLLSELASSQDFKEETTAVLETNLQAVLHHNKLHEGDWSSDVFRLAVTHWLNYSAALGSLRAKTESNDLHKQLSEMLRSQLGSGNSKVNTEMAAKSLTKVLLAYKYVPREFHELSASEVKQNISSLASLVVNFLTELQELSRTPVVSKKQAVQLLRSQLAPIVHLPARIVIDFYNTFWADAQTSIRFHNPRTTDNVLLTVGTFAHEYLSFLGEVSGLFEQEYNLGR